MCNCITDLEKQIVDEQPFEGLVVKSAKVVSAGFMLTDNSLDRRITGELEIKVEGRKRNVKKFLSFSHCPICGKPYLN